MKRIRNKGHIWHVDGSLSQAWRPSLEPSPSRSSGTWPPSTSVPSFLPSATQPARPNAPLSSVTRSQRYLLRTVSHSRCLEMTLSHLRVLVAVPHCAAGSGHLRQRQPVRPRHTARWEDALPRTGEQRLHLPRCGPGRHRLRRPTHHGGGLPHCSRSNSLTDTLSVWTHEWNNQSNLYWALIKGETFNYQTTRSHVVNQSNFNSARGGEISPQPG